MWCGVQCRSTRERGYRWIEATRLPADVPAGCCIRVSWVQRADAHRLARALTPWLLTLFSGVLFCSLVHSSVLFCSRVRLFVLFCCRPGAQQGGTVVTASDTFEADVAIAGGVRHRMQLCHACACTLGDGRHRAVACACTPGGCTYSCGEHRFFLARPTTAARPVRRRMLGVSCAAAAAPDQSRTRMYRHNQPVLLVSPRKECS